MIKQKMKTILWATLVNWSDQLNYKELLEEAWNEDLFIKNAPLMKKTTLGVHFILHQRTDYSKKHLKPFQSLAAPYLLCNTSWYYQSLYILAKGQQNPSTMEFIRSTGFFEYMVWISQGQIPCADFNIIYKYYRIFTLLHYCSLFPPNVFYRNKSTTTSSPSKIPHCIINLCFITRFHIMKCLIINQVCHRILITFS